MAELELKIKKTIEQGYNHVYCMIDLDNKKEGKNKSDQPEEEISQQAYF